MAGNNTGQEKTRLKKRRSPGLSGDLRLGFLFHAPTFCIQKSRYV